MGQEVAAIGHPQGYANSLSRGVVSGLGRMFRGGPHIQTDAAINPGSSGGPLLSGTGRLAGICCSGYPRFPGLNFAIPVGPVLERLRELQDHFDALSEALYCPVCGALAFTAATYCGDCGSVLPRIRMRLSLKRVRKRKNDERCAMCRHQVDAADLYCGRCGASAVVLEDEGEN